MQVLIQCVIQASVKVEGQTIGAIEQGLLILLCAERGDTDALIEKMLSKILKLRIFSDKAPKLGADSYVMQVRKKKFAKVKLEQ
ncbi:D-aminoacyl-tRNA deacylase [Variovorax sp. PCZ-1]|uniref:D-aminoacyl-tRNA deacylase n=1 Tax=Variovorax sp. PCZ-1 TaxID=2835533 RepID=UPI001BCA8E9D|nr:D-aminoacyl-tRNA deacylase [Variovorax sp. PCZ-1]MBS7808254.1 D-aminoacyl-tRNA deacylase [Variovorax sp. PCZ-1]